jgi:tetratricopeptide (TPR) repeat protein
MFDIRLLIMIAIIAWHTPAMAATSVDHCKQLLQSAGEKLSSGMVGDAHTLIDEAMQAAGADPLKQADCYEMLGRTQISENVLGLADESFKKALELRESKLGSKHALVLQTCKEYGELLQKLDRKDEARQLLERVSESTATAKVESATKTPGKSQTKFDQFVQAARLAESKSDNDGALTNWKLAAEEAEKSGSKDRLAFALVHVGDKYHAKKDNEQAVASYQKALSIRQSAAMQNVGTARNISRLANLQMAKQNYAEAQRLLEQALAIEDQTPGGDSVRRSILQSLASIALINQQTAKAEEYSKKLLDLTSKTPGVISEQQRASALAVMMGIYFRTGRTQEGMRLRDQVTSSMSQSSSPDHIKAMQAAYVAAEKEIDDTEEKTFKP